MMERFELAPDGRKSVETFWSLKAAVERARVLLSSRPGVRR
jgi:hypothetical protein